MFLGVLDFEANCTRDGVLAPQEIIEVPVVVYCTATGRILRDREFHSYCKPTVPVTPFCTELTGITAATLEGAPPFRAVYADLQRWYYENGWSADTFAWVTCGHWDLGTALPSHAAHCGVRVNAIFKRWVNVKDVFRALLGRKPGGMPDMLAALGLELQGRHHSGIDDARNIARAVQALDALACQAGRPGVWRDLTTAAAAAPGARGARG